MVAPKRLSSGKNGPVALLRTPAGGAIVLAMAAGLACSGVLDTEVSGQATTASGAGGGSSASGSTGSSAATATGDDGGSGATRPDGGGDSTPYGPCPDGGPCPLDPMEACITDDVDAPTYSFCSATCLDVSQCPAAPSGSAVPSCEPLTPLGIPFSACVLRCETGATCPDGMACTMLLPDLGWCTWGT